MLLKIRIFVIVILLGIYPLNQKVFSQSALTSKYILNPESNFYAILNEVDFFKKAKDNIYGGFYNNLDEKGNIVLRKKSICSHSRLAYAFSKAFMITGDTNYLNLADHALQFQYKYGWDKVNGGWIFSTEENGTAAPPYSPNWNPNSYKWGFQQHYAMVGPLAFVEAKALSLIDSNNVNVKMINESIRNLYDKMWDTRNDYSGYYDNANLNWSNPSGKGFTPTVDAITTNALATYLLTEDVQYKNRLINLADNIYDNLYKSMLSSMTLVGFMESYNNNWVPDYSNSSGSIGHVLKTSWCLARAFLIDKKEEYKISASDMIKEIYEKGYDKTFGGPFTNYDWSSGYIEEGKDYWMTEQAILAGLINAYISDNEQEKNLFLKIAEESIDFYHTNFVDTVNGSTFFSTTNGGIPINTTKGDWFKAGYHAVELFYLTYLYSNLFINNKDVVLYYKVDNYNQNNSIKLNPLEIEDSKLKLVSASLNGIELQNYNRDTRTITFSSGDHGILKCTFRSNNSTTSNSENIVVNDYILYQNYPNPFNPETKIKFSLAESDYVKLEVYDALGKLVSTLIDEYKPLGIYEVNFVAGDHASGLYVYRLMAGTKSISKKMILLK